MNHAVAGGLHLLALIVIVTCPTISRWLLLPRVDASPRWRHRRLAVRRVIASLPGLLLGFGVAAVIYAVPASGGLFG